MDLNTKAGRVALISQIESKANQGRKTSSYKASEVYNDRIKDYVIESLREQFSEQTVREIPIVSSVNIAKRVINQLSCIYRDAPLREFTELSDDQADKMDLVYDDMQANKKLNLANKIYKNHDQCLIQVIPRDGKLIMRVLKPHQWDAVPSDADPEIAKAYIISSYDNQNELLEASKEVGSATGYQSISESNKENYKNQQAIDAQEKDDGKVFLVWNTESNFFMNSKGDVIGEPLDNPLKEFGIMPFVEVHQEKEFEYWIRTQNAYSNFTVEFNAAMSQVQQVVKMQGFAQAVLKGPAELLMENVQIGPNFVLKLPMDANAGIDTSFEFANPNSDIAGSINFLEVLLTSFLSSSGIDVKTVSLSGEGQAYTSGLERLLSMIEKASASREDYDTFDGVEDRVYKLVTAWLTVLSNSNNLDQKYKVGVIPNDSQVKVKYVMPEMVTSEAEDLDIAQRKIDMGLASAVSIIMERDDLTREQAIEKYIEYQEDVFLSPEPKNHKEA